MTLIEIAVCICLVFVGLTLTNLVKAMREVIAETPRHRPSLSKQDVLEILNLLKQYWEAERSTGPLPLTEESIIKVMRAYIEEDRKIDAETGVRIGMKDSYKGKY